MNENMTPLNFLITTIAWGVNEWQAKRIEFLCREIEVYRRLVGDGRSKLTDDERRELGALGKAAGLEGLRELPTLVKRADELLDTTVLGNPRHDHMTSALPTPGRGLVDMALSNERIVNDYWRPPRLFHVNKADASSGLFSI